MDGVGGATDSGIISMEVDMAAGRAIRGVSGSVSILSAAAALGNDDVTAVPSGPVLPADLFRNIAASALYRRMQR